MFTQTFHLIVNNMTFCFTDRKLELYNLEANRGGERSYTMEDLSQITLWVGGMELEVLGL